VTEPALLELDALNVRYGAVPALHGVSLAVRVGEVVGVVGPNGAGKSTMLSAIMRMVGWSAGDVRFHGQSLARCTSDQVARLGIALVPEGRQIFADLTVDENLRLGMVARRNRDGASADLAKVFELFPMVRESRHRTAGLLSGGQQQQLAIARALLADPDLLLLDEPSLGLAPTVIDAVFESLDTIRRAGRTIVIVEQRAQRTIAFADRTYVLADGRIRAEVGRHDADNGELLRAAYFGASAS
jgi:branched-chain amino acid transport system ATP-binding protein